MADSQDSEDRVAQLSSASVGTGLLVFVIGIVMLVLVFTWGYDLVQSVDEHLLEVRYVPAIEPEHPAEAEGPVAAADPNGPTIVHAAATVALKFLGLLVLGWLGAMVAGKGAEMTGVRRRLQG